MIIAKVKIYRDGSDAGYRTIRITNEDLERLAEERAYKECENDDTELTYAKTEILTRLSL